MAPFTPTAIVIHHSATDDSETLSWPAIRRYHTSYKCEGKIIKPEAVKDLIAQGAPVQKPWRDIGYHFGIEQVGRQFEILVGRMLTETGAHCPQGNMNRNGIGICLVGNFDKEPPPPAQWDLAVRLVQSLMQTFIITPARVFGHRELNPHKTCPGQLFDMERLRRAIKGA